MKIRSDFVSNSSSSSFIVYGNSGIEYCNKHFGGVEYYKVKDLRMQNIILRDSINAAIQNYCSALKIDSNWCVNDSHLNGQFIWDLKNQIESIDNFIKHIDEVFGKDIPDDVYVTSPIDRDDACERDFYNSCWETDL